MQRQSLQCPWMWNAQGTHRPMAPWPPMHCLVAAAVLDWILCWANTIKQCCSVQTPHIATTTTTQAVRRLLLSNRRASANLSISCKNLACRAALLASSAEDTVQTTSCEQCFRTIALRTPRGCARKPLLVVKRAVTSMVAYGKRSGVADFLWVWGL